MSVSITNPVRWLLIVLGGGLAFPGALIYIRGFLWVTEKLGSADAMTYKDIAGQWCGDVTDYVFTPDVLTVKFHDSRPANVFKITKYTYTNNSVRIDWLNDAGKESVTVLLNSSATVPPWRSSRTATNHAAPEVVFLEDLSRRGYGQNRRRKRHGKFWGGQLLTVAI
jgi:hypothetical protein